MASLARFMTFFIASFAPVTNSFPTQGTSALTHASTQPQKIYQYPLGTWVENIAFRQNGNFLVTFTQPHAELHEINPLAPPHTDDPAVTLIHNFTTHTQCTGMAELEPDVFAVIADTTVYRVDLRGRHAAVNLSSGVAVSPIATLAEDGLPNGMARLPNTSHLLIADSTLGQIWRVDARTGNYTAVLKDATMAPNTDLGLLLGINGLRYLAGYVYYNNSPRRLFCRVPVDVRTGMPLGPVEVVADGVMADDFAVRMEYGAPVAYLAGLNDNVITKVPVGGQPEVIAGGLNSTAVAGASSAAFGRTEQEQDVLFVTTGGASASPVNGTYVEGGKIVALRI